MWDTTGSVPPTDSFRRLVDRTIDGGLDAFLLDARARGESYQTTQARLLAEHDIDVSAETVRNWTTKAEKAARV